VREALLEPGWRPLPRVHEARDFREASGQEADGLAAQVRPCNAANDVPGAANRRPLEIDDERGDAASELLESIERQGGGDIGVCRLGVQVRQAEWRRKHLGHDAEVVEGDAVGLDYPREEAGVSLRNVGIHRTGQDVPRGPMEHAPLTADQVVVVVEDDDDRPQPASDAREHELVRAFGVRLECSPGSQARASLVEPRRLIWLLAWPDEERARARQLAWLRRADRSSRIHAHPRRRILDRSDTSAPARARDGRRQFKPRCVGLLSARHPEE
jgi:hypothetical protein